MYQGARTASSAPAAPIEAASEDWGVDSRPRSRLVTDNVPMGTPVGRSAGRHIKLVMLVNDVTRAP